MARNNIQTDPSNALIIDPQTDKCLGEIRLGDDSVPASEWIHASGELKSFVILGSRSELWNVWVDQKEILLRTESGQRLAKIITYPAEGETQGYLDYIGAFEAFPAQTESKFSAQKGLAFLQSLLGT